MVYNKLRDKLPTLRRFRYCMKRFLEPTNNSFFQVIRFAIVGLVATLVDFSIMKLFLGIFLFKYGYLFASSLGFVAGVGVSYLFSISWVFSNRSVKNVKLEFVIFIVIGIFGLVLNQVLMFLCMEISPFKEYIVLISEKIYQIYDWSVSVVWMSKIFATIIVFFWNFFARKFILFRKF